MRLPARVPQRLRQPLWLQGPSTPSPKPPFSMLLVLLQLRHLQKITLGVSSVSPKIPSHPDPSPFKPDLSPCVPGVPPIPVPSITVSPSCPPRSHFILVHPPQGHPQAPPNPYYLYPLPVPQGPPPKPHQGRPNPCPLHPPTFPHTTHRHAGGSASHTWGCGSQSHTWGSGSRTWGCARRLTSSHLGAVNPCGDTQVSGDGDMVPAGGQRPPKRALLVNAGVTHPQGRSWPKCRHP